jgi:hypothetical protein
VSCPHLEIIFIKLNAAGYKKTSETTGYPPAPGAYNCIAWAANDSRQWWWPDSDSYWPAWSERKLNIGSFVKAFHRLGYRICGHSRVEFAFEKVALYTLNDEPKHMARQLRDGTWTSKCGGLEDINHFTLDAVESYGPHPEFAEYGAPELYMKRFIPVAWVVKLVQCIAWKIQEYRDR